MLNSTVYKPLKLQPCENATADPETCLSPAQVDFLATNLGGDITDSVVLTKTTTCNFGDLCLPGALPIAPARGADVTRHDAIARMHAQWRCDGMHARLSYQAGRGGASLSCEGVGVVPPEQVAALQDLYMSTNGTAWMRSTNWMNGGERLGLQKTPGTADCGW